MDAFMNIVNYLSQAFLISCYFAVIFKPRFTHRISFAMLFVLQSVIYLVGFFLLYHEKYRIAVVIPLSFLSVCFLYRASFFKKLFYYLILQILTLVMEVICFALIKAFLNIDPQQALLLKYRAVSNCICLMVVYISFGIVLLFLKRTTLKLKPSDWIKYSVFPISQLVVLSAYVGSIIYNPSRYSVFAVTISIVMSAVSCGYLYYLLTELTQKARLEADAKFLQEKVNIQYCHYKQLREQMEITAKYRHDIVNHLETMQQLIANGNLENANNYMNQMRKDFK